MYLPEDGLRGKSSNGRITSDKKILFQYFTYRVSRIESIICIYNQPLNLGMSIFII